MRPGADAYSYGFGGQACRMVEVEYSRRPRSTYCRMLVEKGGRQWIRTDEYDSAIMTVVTAGEANGKYGASYTEIRKQQRA